MPTTVTTLNVHSLYSRTSIDWTPVGLFTIADLNSFLSPYKVLPIAQENKCLGKFSYFIVKLYVECTHQNHLIKAILMSTLNIQLLCRKSKKKIPKLSPFASWLGTIINPQWLELPMSWTHFHGPKDVRAIEVRLYLLTILILKIEQVYLTTRWSGC